MLAPLVAALFALGADDSAGAVDGPAAVARATAAAAGRPTEELDLVDASRLDPRFVVDIRYATTDNFTGRRLYPVGRCLLRRAIGEKLVLAQRWLDRNAPGYVLVLKDCYRPAHLQRLMFDVVRGTPKETFVANPDKGGSVHNFAAAVDLTLARDGREVDMGTPYDFFGALAEPRFEERFVAEGRLTRAQVERRRALRDAMVKGGGFKTIANEWWHFDALQGAELRTRYRMMDVPLDAVP